MTRAVTERIGRVDILVNDAGLAAVLAGGDADHSVAQTRNVGGGNWMS